MLRHGAGDALSNGGHDQAVLRPVATNMDLI
jgi:hypothetical protein